MKKIIYLTALLISSLFYSCDKGELEAIAPDITIEAKANENILANETSKILLTIKSTQTDATYTIKFNTDKEAVLNGQANNGEIILRNGEHILTYDPNDVAYGEHNVTLTITNDFGKTIEKKFKINISDPAFITVDKEEQEVTQTLPAYYTFSIKDNNANLTYQAHFPEVFPRGLEISDGDDKGFAVYPNAIIEISKIKSLKIKLVSRDVRDFSIPITFKSSNGFNFTKTIKYNTKQNTIIMESGDSDYYYYPRSVVTSTSKFSASIYFHSPLLNSKIKFKYRLLIYDDLGRPVSNNSIFYDIPNSIFTSDYFYTHQFNGVGQNEWDQKGIRYCSIEIFDDFGNSTKNNPQFIFRQD